MFGALRIGPDQQFLVELLAGPQPRIGDCDVAFGTVRVAHFKPRQADHEAGKIIVAGHSDSVPLTPGRFRDNAELSQARAEAVMKLMAKSITDPKRLLAEGRGDKEPIADNGTKEGRATNRRIEILLVKGGAN